MTVDELIAATNEASALAASLPYVLRHALIGSASYLPADQVNDVDVALRLKMSQDVNDYCWEVLGAQHGFTECGEYDTSSGGAKWRAMRRGNVNLIVTNDGDFYDRFLAATEVCKALRLTKKEDRIAVCQIVRDGRTADEVAPKEDLFQ